MATKSSLSARVLSTLLSWLVLPMAFRPPKVKDNLIRTLIVVLASMFARITPVQPAPGIHGMLCYIPGQLPAYHFPVLIVLELASIYYGRWLLCACWVTLVQYIQRQAGRRIGS